MQKKEITLGIDIGATNTKVGIVDRPGECLANSVLPTKADEPIENFLPRLFSTIDALMADFADSVELLGIGIGAPNANYYTGLIEQPANLSWADKTPLAQLVTNNYQVPVKLTNDANAAAIGEMKFGVAKGMKNFVVLTLGTGLGSGIVVNGEVLYGADGFAGEFGHIIVNTQGRMCGANRRGCLEAYVSATGICRTVYKLLADYPWKSELRSISFNNLTAEMITEAALNGDKIAIEAFEYTGRIFGMKLADLVAILSPEAIILFGGLTRAKQHLFEPTKRYMEQYMFPIFKNKVKLLASGLEGANTAVLGASALIWNELDRKTQI
jgi:glucokinase